MEWVVNATTRSFYPRERPGPRCVVVGVGLSAGLDGCGKSRPHRDSISKIVVREPFLKHVLVYVSLNLF